MEGKSGKKENVRWKSGEKRKIWLSSRGKEKWKEKNDLGSTNFQSLQIGEKINEVKFVEI